HARTPKPASFSLTAPAPTTIYTFPYTTLFRSPEIITKGTLAFALVFPNGFKAVLVGSAGPITDGVRELARKIGPVDVAIIAYQPDRKSTRLNSSHVSISYAVFCLKKKKKYHI